MSKIIENLYLGNIDDVGSVKFIRENNIKLIINAAIEVIVPIHEDVNIIMNLQWHDSMEQSINFCFLDYLTNVIHSFLKENKAVLVNCFAGISRSSTIVIAYMMNYHNMAFDEAFNYVQGKRWIVNPNPNFQIILKNYERYLLDKKQSL
jgi:protein-tyrosine phosphatase